MAKLRLELDGREVDLRKVKEIKLIVDSDRGRLLLLPNECGQSHVFTSAEADDDECDSSMEVDWNALIDNILDYQGPP